ncbi:MAG: hypothetical protein AB1726_04510 [Planctomycetota bacterium]
MNRPRSTPLPGLVLAAVGALGGSACRAEEPPAGDPATPATNLAELTAAELAAKSEAEIWALGVRWLHWDPAGPPAGATKDELVGWFLSDTRIRDFDDTNYTDYGEELQDREYRR